MTLESLKVKVDNIDDDIKEIKQSIADHKRDTQTSINALTNTINMVKDNQADQKLINQKMDFTLDSINSERVRDKEDRQKRDEQFQWLKRWIIGLVGTLVGSLVWTTLRYFLGI